MTTITTLNLLYLGFVCISYQLIKHSGIGGLFLGVDYYLAKLWLYMIAPLIGAFLNLVGLGFLQEDTADRYWVLGEVLVPILTILVLWIRAHIHQAVLNYHHRQIARQFRDYLKQVGCEHTYQIKEDQIILFKKKAPANRITLVIQDEKAHQTFVEQHQPAVAKELEQTYSLKLTFQYPGQ